MKKILVLQRVSNEQILKNQGQCWLLTAVSDIVPFAILWGFWTKWWLLGSISFQCLPWVQHNSSFSFTVNWSGWSSASLTRGLQRGHFIILRYLVLKILCKDYSIALELLSICWKYVKCLCLKGATVGQKVFYWIKNGVIYHEQSGKG